MLQASNKMHEWKWVFFWNISALLSSSWRCKTPCFLKAHPELHWKRRMLSPYGFQHLVRFCLLCRLNKVQHYLILEVVLACLGLVKETTQYWTAALLSYRTGKVAAWHPIHHLISGLKSVFRDISREENNSLTIAFDSLIRLANCVNVALCFLSSGKITVITKLILCKTVYR